MLKRRLLIFFFLLHFGLFAQQFKMHPSYEWTSDSSLLIKVRGTNFSAAYLANFTVAYQSLKKEEILFKEDSVLIKKGITQSRHYIFFERELLNELDSSILLELVFRSVVDQHIIGQNSLIVYPEEKKKADFEFNDSTLVFRNESEEPFIANIQLFDADSEEQVSFDIPLDTSIYTWEIIKENPLQARELVISLMDENGLISADTLLYLEGKFLKDRKQLKEERKKEKETTALIQVSGSFAIENNAFSNTPQHSNALQYPNTSFVLNNTISVMGIPFRLNATHTTNDNIDPNFRNFFSLDFDVDAYRRQKLEEWQSEEMMADYSLPEIDEDLQKNRASAERLQDLKSTLLKYPDQEINVDSLLAIEAEQLKQSESLDSLSAQVNYNGQYSMDSLAYPDSLVYPDSVAYDSNLNAEKLKKIDRYMERYEQSNRYKEQLRGKKLNQELPSTQTLPAKEELFRKFQGKGIASLLLRFEKLEIGNFYEFAGKYSIRDVEMKGVNASLLVNPDVKAGLLVGKLNDFQSFNLDNIEKDIRVSSVAITHLQWDFFRPTLRVTEFKDASVNNELSTVSSQNFVSSFSANGDVASFLFYEAEVNRSNNSFESTLSKEDEMGKSMALYTKLEVSPFEFLSIHAKYDQVGSNYQSEGVYFLTRDLQSYSIGTQLKLFKRKIYFKNDYTIINRNFEQKELTNSSEKFFFDLGSRFKRIPNFQIIHSPISVDIANKLDTSFTALNAFSSVTIARVFYVKKVKKTIYNSALIYSEILNDFFEGKDKQRGFQHFVGIANEKVQFSFTSSYSEIFEQIRFVSSSYSQQINEKFLVTVYMAKNFQEDRYSEILRTKVDWRMNKHLLLGGGGMMLLERNQAANWGSVLSLKLLY